MAHSLTHSRNNPPTKQIAWKNPEYAHLWEGLREEFEVEYRFSNLKYKLNLIQDNTKFFLEIMHNQKSNMLEWVIIVLISAEIVVCSMDLCDIKPTWALAAASDIADYFPMLWK